MAFNIKEIEVLRYGRKQELKNSTLNLTPGAENCIERKECLRDLEIQMSEDARFAKVQQKC
jgi:hypothetical protein